MGCIPNRLTNYLVSDISKYGEMIISGKYSTINKKTIVS